MSVEEPSKGYSLPFASYYLSLNEGRLHYLDEGAGHPLVLVHGNPEWCFSYRKTIDKLSDRYRCIAPDHLGFGASEKPAGADLSPRAHARRLASFLEALGIERCSLVMNDWGGPIGMAVAENDPQRFEALVVMNSWLWPLNKSPLFQIYSRVMGGAIGRALIRKWNLLIRWGMPLGFAHPSRFDVRLREHYERPFRDPSQRRGQWVFARHILKDAPWFEALWKEREKLRNKPVLFLKGHKDMAFTKRNLRKWRRGFPDAWIRRITNAGHFPHEEEGEEVARYIDAFLKGDLKQH